MDRETALRNLRLAAIDRLVGREVGSDKLVRLGVEAVLAEVGAPSLPLLAGLSRAEEPEARHLFERVVEELNLAPSDLPDERTARAWALVWWWAQLIVDGVLDVHTGGELIYRYGWAVLDNHGWGPLDSLIGSIVQHDNAVSSWAIWDASYTARSRGAAARVVEAARELLSHPWAPDDAVNGH